MLVGIDSHAQVADFYWEYVGLEDHLSGSAVNRVGVWVDDQFSWLSDSGWNIASDYRNETLSGYIVAVNDRLSVELVFQDVVYNEKPIFLRSIIVKNKTNRARLIKVFLGHQFRMYGELKKDTVYYDPQDRTIVHYKGRRVAVIGGSLEGNDSFSQYSVGLSEIEGKEGTWKDAEDGHLTLNSIEHGTVDSTVGFEKVVEADDEFSFYSWVSMGKTLEESKLLHKYVLKKNPEHILKSTRDYWFAWVNKNTFSFHGLGSRAEELFKKSLLITRTHVDNTGGIIASGDSDMLWHGRDNYSYVWMRDAAFTAISLDRAGYYEVVRNFYLFSKDVISEEGYFHHRYRCDKSLGSSWHPWIKDGKPRIPIQEDETALVIYALWTHYQYTKDLEFIESLYNPLIKKASDFMLGFRNTNKLPKSSYDLWEEKFGIHTFTAATVCAALDVAAKFARILGKRMDEHLYSQGSREIKNAIIETMYSEEDNYFYKYVHLEDGELLHDKTIDASTFYGIFKFGILDIGDDRLEKMAHTLETRLKTQGEFGNIVRYENDQYVTAHQEDTPGNPWIITTLWLAQYYIKKAKHEEDMAKAKELIDWTVRCALPSGILSEQIDPFTGGQLSAAPLAWSHAEYVTTIVEYMEKLEELGISKVIISPDE